MIERTIRYQAAILQDSRILLVRTVVYPEGRDFWLLPGGGRQDGESEEECILREVEEETYLKVRVERLLLHETWQANKGYTQSKTYLCQVVEGQAAVGCEPEPELAGRYAIVEVGWFDLRDESAWGEKLLGDPLTYPELKKIRKLLGFAA